MFLGRDGLLYVHTLFTAISGKAVQMTGYTSCNYFSKARAFTLTALVGSSTAATVWYSVFQVRFLFLRKKSFNWQSENQYKNIDYINVEIVTINFVKVLIDSNKLTLSQLSYIWLSFGLIMFLSSFLFLDWKFNLFNLPYNFDTKFEKIPLAKIHGKKLNSRFH